MNTSILSTTSTKDADVFDMVAMVKEICEIEKSIICPLRTEVQSHGFTWELDLLTSVYGASLDELRKIPYTSKFDLPASLNRLGNYSISVKTTSTMRTVCMADALRLFDICESGERWSLVVVYYVQNDLDKIKHLRRIVEIDMTNSRSELYGTLTREQIARLDAEVKKVPQRRHPTTAEHDSMYSLQGELHQHSGAIFFNIKCDSRQSRLQCSFNKFDDFLRDHPTRVISQSNTAEFHGNRVIDQVHSGRRILKKRAKTT
jgi:hypothetical protein